MKPDKQKIIAFAQRMSELLYEMRIEDLENNLDVDNTLDFDEEFMNKILEDKGHVALIKDSIRTSIIAKLLDFPETYFNHEINDYEYKTDTYDHAFLMDVYIQNIWEEQHQARLKKRWKVWIEIERHELDPETGDEDFIDEETPFGIAYRDSLEDALKLREEINKSFGEIDPPLPF